MTEPEPKPVHIRWQCPRGHFVADSAIRCTDHLDPFGSHYGIASDWEYDCRACGKTYDSEPRIAVVRDNNPVPPEIAEGCWRTTPEGREWQAALQDAVNRRVE